MSSDDRALRPSASFPPHVVHEIQRAADEGVYEIRGYGGKRKVPSFDDLLLLGASVSRYPLEGYRERCDTDLVLGAQHAEKPIAKRLRKRRGRRRSVKRLRKLHGRKRSAERLKKLPAERLHRRQMGIS